MAYSGFLIKVGDYIIPANKYIKADSYSVYRNIQDLDSYRDANGFLHRNVLSHVANKVEFETPAMINNVEFANLMKNIQRNYMSSLEERKALVTLYIPEIDDYVILDDHEFDFMDYTQLWERLLLTDGIERAEFASRTPEVEAIIFMDYIWKFS